MNSVFHVYTMLTVYILKAIRARRSIICPYGYERKEIAYIMPVHGSNGAVVCTPDGTAMKSRIARLKRELGKNQ